MISIQIFHIIPQHPHYQCHCMPIPSESYLHIFRWVSPPSSKNPALDGPSVLSALFIRRSTESSSQVSERFFRTLQKNFPGARWSLEIPPQFPEKKCCLSGESSSEEFLFEPQELWFNVLWLVEKQGTRMEKCATSYWETCFGAALVPCNRLLRLINQPTNQPTNTPTNQPRHFGKDWGNRIVLPSEKVGIPLPSLTHYLNLFDKVGTCLRNLFLLPLSLSLSPALSLSLVLSRSPSIKNQDKFSFFCEFWLCVFFHAICMFFAGFWSWKLPKTHAMFNILGRKLPCCMLFAAFGSWNLPFAMLFATFWSWNLLFWRLFKAVVGCLLLVFGCCLLVGCWMWVVACCWYSCVSCSCSCVGCSCCRCSSCI